MAGFLINPLKMTKNKMPYSKILQIMCKRGKIIVR